ncbi:class I SAM-dependent methyltransferase [Granulicella tundricola]|uniref:Methyltransferase domain-containing protein n=1 Tax=Granulicella tundricola (strain ATCC BAA-1859 / DSM 23138 / MP5ACTX9) TaxID=1198114 RepID=E8X5M7_GRATM|nr:class I SAM-dependent methyltransferase [Granulicella tundricola]ADW70654.1 hypothetical protein AciX9_3651 [Granulicella tundricola MP5ACTX9]
MRLLYRLLLHAIDNHGLRGTILRAIRPPRQSTAAPEPSSPEVHPFDQRHHTDTSGYVPGEALATGTPADLYNTAYYAISPSTLTQAIAALPISPTQYTFVDLGCGKGRALLIAAHQNFRHIAGIELSPTLAASARTNTTTHPNITIQTADAATVLYPPGPLVVFFYHPFLAPLLRKVLTNLTDQSNNRDIYLLSANPGYPKVFARFPMLEQQWTKDFTLSEEDASADRHGILFERYTLWHLPPTA